VRKAAFDAARAWAESPHAGQAGPDIAAWLETARRNEKPSYLTHIGHVRIAFVEAFRHLLNSVSFSDALSDTLQGGGDTDTNAAIVCGLMGAAVGRQGIPKDMIDSVVQSDTMLGEHVRPERLHPREADALVLEAMTHGPLRGGLRVPRDTFKSDLWHDVYEKDRPYGVEEHQQCT
jgi:ADP-ribosyl-[dinitrogen reductase] hydrolase